MATKEYYLGSVGPLMYEDSDEYPDSSPGSELYHHALRGEQILIETAPTLEDHVLRKSDMPDFSSMNAEKGDILYFDGTNWVVLHHGDTGQVLKTGGHDGIPAWDDEELDDLSDVAITSAERGDILYRNASGWVNLHHGTDGQIFTTKGDGADPIWADLPADSGDWITDTDTWVYVNATSFKIEGKDVTSRFPVGCKLCFTQTSAKYFYVVSTAFSTDTIVTVTGGSDYTIANAMITSPKYSYASSPTGFPQFFNWTETWNGFSTVPTDGVSRFQIVGRMLDWWLNRITDGTSNNATHTVIGPVAAVNITNYYQRSFGMAMDNGVWQNNAALAKASPGSATINISKDCTTTIWTNSGSSNWVGKISYEI